MPTDILILSLLSIFLPLLSFGVVWLFKSKNLSALAATILLGLSMISSLLLFLGVWPDTFHLFSMNWFQVGPSIFKAGIYINGISVIIGLVINLISFLVHIFSLEYMANDPGKKRYFSFLGLFTFSMLGIIFADGLMVIFIFWELVGLSSYLLIGFWFKKHTASKAARKAFIVNRIGDVGFLVGILIIWSHFGTTDLFTLQQIIEQGSFSSDHLVFGENKQISTFWLHASAIGLFCGVLGKSAQFPLQVWLPDAMEGPTPVSALIHAATMVAAGIYLLGRVYFLIPFDVLPVIATIGTITAFMGGYAALMQNDIKKVLAYSTISQLGYMVIGVGVGATDSALFHLITHAFFKACLFLSAGSVIHSLHKIQVENFDPQDMRFMGGIRKYMPVTFWCYLISMLSLSGLPFFTGFLSKDAIINASYAWAVQMSSVSESVFYYIIPFLALFTAFLTALYMGRQLFLVFFGQWRLKKLYHNLIIYPVENNFKITIPLLILALGCFSLSFSLNPFNASDGWVYTGLSNFYVFQAPGLFLENLDHQAQSTHNTILFISIVSAVLGLTLAFILFKPGRKFEKGYVHSQQMNFVMRLSFHNFYLDWIYEKTFIRAFNIVVGLSKWLDKIIDLFIDSLGYFAVIISSIISWFDDNLVDGLVNFISKSLQGIGQLTRNIQAKRIQMQLTWSLIGVIFLLFIILGFRN